MNELQKTCDYFSITEDQLRSTKRDANLVQARQFYTMIMLNKNFGVEMIGAKIKRNHTMCTHYRINHYQDMNNKDYAARWNDYSAYMNGLIEVPLTVDQAVTIRDKQWTDLLVSFYGMTLNSTLLEKIKLKIIAQKLK